MSLYSFSSSTIDSLAADERPSVASPETPSMFARLWKDPRFSPITNFIRTPKAPAIVAPVAEEGDAPSAAAAAQRENAAAAEVEQPLRARAEGP